MDHSFYATCGEAIIFASIPVTCFYRVHSSSLKKVNSGSLWCNGPHNGLYLDMAMEIPSSMLTFRVVIGFWTLPHVFFSTQLVMHKITNLIPVRMEWGGRLASGGDVKGWDRHEGGPGSSSVVDLEAILEGLLAHLIVVELIKNVLVTGGLVFDNVQEGLIDVVWWGPLLVAQHGTEGQSGPSILVVVLLSSSKSISECR